MKSIRKDDVKTTAKELGVKVGDKFVVLSSDDSYSNHEFLREYCGVGDILTLDNDDGSFCPCFKNNSNGKEFYENFSCLARYEDVDVTQTCLIDKGLNLEVVEASFGNSYDKDDGTMMCKVEINNITFEQYQKLLNFINTL